jgi:ATP-binding cassette subfamily B protein
MDERTGTARALRMLLGAARRADPWRTVVVFVLQALSQVATLAFAVGIGALVAAAAGHDRGQGLLAAGALTLFLAGLWAAVGGGARLRVALEERVACHLETVLIGAATSSPTIEPFFDEEYRRHLALLQRNRELLERSFGALAVGAAVLLRAVVGVGLLAFVHPLLALLPLFGLPSMLLARRAESGVARAGEAAADGLRRSHHWFDMATGDRSGLELQLSGGGNHVVRLHRRELADAHRTLRRAELRSLILTGAGRLAFVAGYTAAVLFAAHRAVTGRTGVGPVVTVVVLGAQISTMLGATAARLSWLRRSLSEAGRFLWLLDYHRRPPAPGEPVPSSPEGGVAGTIAVRGLGYHYPGSSRWAIRDVDLDLEPGTVVAIVGENGSGKSTLVHCLCGLLEPGEGAVGAAGSLSAAFQDHARFEFAAWEAIGLGDVTRLNDRDAVITALTRAEAAELVDELPSGLDTQLGAAWTGGVDLSGGQWQQVAVGRAMMRTPNLMVLDEPTASLDPRTEHNLFRRFASLDRAALRGGVLVLVSHRFAGVVDADQILVMDGGRLVDRGRHADLVARNGLYARLYRAQARMFT